jgi:hypothetical protein
LVFQDWLLLIGSKRFLLRVSFSLKKNWFFNFTDLNKPVAFLPAYFYLESKWAWMLDLLVFLPSSLFTA